MISLGPFLTQSDHPDIDEVNLLHTGFSLELVTNETCFEFPLYRSAQVVIEHTAFKDFYVAEPEQGWPVEFWCRAFQEKNTPSCRTIQLSPVLRAIFEQLQFGMSVEAFLSDFRSAIPVSSYDQSGWLYPTVAKIDLTPDLEAAGFITSAAWCYGTTLSVDIAWSFNDGYKGWQNIVAAFLEFKPRCRKLNEGKWIKLRYPEGIEKHFFDRFAKIAPPTPFACFRDDEARDVLLAHFEWSSTTLHSEAELRQKRIDAVLSATALWENPKILAETLKALGLYSEATSASQIVKSLPSLIFAAKNRES